MEKTIFLLITILLVFQYGRSVWAQNQGEGKKLYATYCSSCHGEDGKGDGPHPKRSQSNQVIIPMAQS